MIERDGACISLWQSTADGFQSNLNTRTTSFDVAIVGGGITGITTALLLQKAGKKCVVFEAFNLCFGTSSGTTAHLNTLLDNPYTTLIKNFGKENATLVAQATEAALQLIQSNIETYNIDCDFEEATAYLFSQTDKQNKELEDIYDAYNEVGLKALYADELAVDIDHQKIMQLGGQAKFHPVKYVQALAKAFEQSGGVIYEHCHVDEVDTKEKISLTTASSNFTSDYLIYATHIPPGINLLHLRCSPYRSYAMAVTLKSNDYPKDLYYDMYDPYHYIRSQTIDGKTCLIVGGEDHKTGEIENTNECFLKLEAYVRKYFEVDEVLNKWSSQYFEPADALPYIGVLPGAKDNVLVATGYGGNGLTYSNIAAPLLKSMVLKEENDLQNLFKPSRIKPVAGFVQFISHNADVAKQFASKLLPSEKLNELAGLANDEGKVVKFEGESVALYKEDNGAVHAVNPVCTHMKCSVAWNTAEKTWECPCHGARYNMDGVVVTGPSTINLEKIALADMVKQ